MLETLTLALATPIAKAILDKFYEGVGSELAKKAVNELPGAVQDKIQKLGQLVWDRCLKHKDPNRAKELLEQAAAGSTAAQTALNQGLSQTLANDPELERAVQPLAAEIQQAINIGGISGGEVWNVFGGKAEKNEFTDNKAPIIKDNTGTVNIHYGPQPD